MADPREALRRELDARGYRVESDTRASRGALYIAGENDLAAALFEFMPTAAHAIDTMYQGSWVEGLPPRFAVMPAEAAGESSFELLEQMRILPLLYETHNDEVVFCDLQAAERHLRT